MSQAVIVIPCYNEAKRLPVEAFKRYAQRGERQKFLFVDDGSNDGTIDVLQSLNQLDSSQFQVMRLSRNSGKAEAVRQGVLAAFEQQPDYVGYWDADLATPLEIVPEFCRVLDETPELDVVMGARVILLGHDIDRHLIRHYLGRLSATCISVAVGIRVYDAMCGAKCFRVTPRTMAMFSEPFESRWVFDAEWLARFVTDLKKSRVRIDNAICELPLRKWKEIIGSKVRWYDFPKAFYDLAKIFWRYRWRRQPLPLTPQMAAAISSHCAVQPEETVT